MLTKSRIRLKTSVIIYRTVTAERYINIYAMHSLLSVEVIESSIYISLFNYIYLWIIFRKL